MKIGIIGAGSAGIQSVSHMLTWTDAKIHLIHDPKISITGIGESTNPTFTTALQYGFDFNIHDSIKNGDLDCTLKLGTVYKKWRENEFINPLLDGNCAIHMNTYKLSEFVIPKLKAKWKDKFTEIKGKITSIENNKDEVILHTKDKTISYDYIIDCRGFPETYDDYITALETVNRCLVHNKIEDGSSMMHTGHIATPDGWMFEVPLSTRISYGYLFNDNVTNLDTAKKNFSKEINVPIDELDNIEYKFKSYYTSKFLDNRIFKNGNRAIFFEPISANSLWCYDSANRLVIDYLSVLKSEKDINLNELESFMNSRFVNFAIDVEQMIAYHYHGGSQYNTAFWNSVSERAKKQLKKTTHLQSMKKIKKKEYALYDERTKWVYNYHNLQIIDKNFRYNYIK